MSNTLWLHEPQHARPPCLSPTPRVHPISCPLSRWCHPTISSSVVPFSSCLQSFPASGSFPMSQFFASGGQSVGVSASTSVLPMNTQDRSPLGWTGCMDLPAVQGTLKSLLQHHMACNSEARPRDGKTEFRAQALLLPSYLTLGYLQDLSMSQFPHL